MFRRILLLMLPLNLVLHAQEPRLTLPSGHSSWVIDAVFTKSGKHFVTRSYDNVILLWDISTGKLLNKFSGHKKRITGVAISPDDKRIITSSDDSTARVWDLVSGEELFVLTDHKGEVKDVAYSKDGSKILTGGSDKILRIWNASTGKALSSHQSDYDIYQFAVNTSKNYFVTSHLDQKQSARDITSGRLLFRMDHSDYVSHTVFSEDESLVLTTSSDGTAKLWNAADGKHLRTFQGRKGALCNGVFTKDKKFVFTEGNNFVVNMWEVATGKLVKAFKGHKMMMLHLSLSADGKYLASTSRDGATKVWLVATGGQVYSLAFPQRVGFGEFASFDPSGKYLVTSGGAKAVVWDLRNGRMIHDLRNRSKITSVLRYSSDGKFIAAIASDSTVKVFDANSGQPAFILSGHRDVINDVAFSPDNKYIATASNDITVKVWDAATGKEVHPLLRHRGSVVSVVFSSDGKRILTGSTDKIARVWNADSGTMESELTGHTGWVTSAVFSADDQYIATRSTDTSVKVWDFKNKKFMYSIPEETFVMGNSFVSFSSDNKFLLTYANNNGRRAKIWDLLTGRQLYVLDHPGKVTSARISNNNKYIVTSAGYAKKAYLWSAETGKLLYTFEGHKDNVSDVMFSKDDARIVTLSDDNTAKVWNTSTGKQLFNLAGHRDEVYSAAFNQSGNRLTTSSGDNLNKVWDMTTGKEVYSFVSIDSADYLLQEPSGFYMASPNAVKQMHYVTNDLRVVTFEQLDIRYNRPDKLLSALKSTDTALLRSYQQAYQKRIRKLNIDTLAFKKDFSIPEADFTNRDNIEYEQRNNQLRLSIKGRDKQFRLDRFNLWVNEVPLFGLQGISLKNRKKNNFDTTITITLSNGENLIETSIVNTNGTESYRMPLHVNHTGGANVVEKVHFIGIGINQFKQAEYNLQWSVKDIRDLARKLKERYGSNLTIDTLFDAGVSREAILALKTKLQSLSVNDKVIVSYSGHGLLSKELDYYLSTYNIDFNNPKSAGLSYDELESLLDNIPPRKKLMFIDACHSGELDKDEVAKIEATRAALDSNGITTKSNIKIKPKKGISMANTFELMQSLFVNVSRSTGATIISAAGGMQYAQERGDLQNGVFTYSVINAFNTNKTLSVSQLKKIVGEQVVQLTKGLQKPTSRNETNMFDWRIW